MIPNTLREERKQNKKNKLQKNQDKDKILNTFIF